MAKYIWQIFFVVFVSLAAFTVASCGGDSAAEPDASAITAASSAASADSDAKSCSSKEISAQSSSAKPSSAGGQSPAEDSPSVEDSSSAAQGASNEESSAQSPGEVLSPDERPSSAESDSAQHGTSSAATKPSDESAASSESRDGANSGASAMPEGDGVCSDCDSFTAADPELTEKGGKGSVTTYGSVTAKETSLGGACNYGQTNIQYYAAIHVNVSPGDDKGPWQGGKACGGCVRVNARTPEGWKTVTVRITDRCPDANCGVDLGGAPASDIMGDRVGRYSGEWEFVSCEGVEGVWGDSTAIWVKEGASTFWSIIQVRNPKDAVSAISVFSVDAGESYELEMVVGTENFWTVPQEVLQNEKSYRVVVSYRTGEDDEWYVKASELATPEATLYLYEHRK